MVKGQAAPTTGSTVTIGVVPSRVAMFRRDDGRRLEPKEHPRATNTKQAREETQPC
jgi:hypothetical protein